jgi:hypothetical protein
MTVIHKRRANDAEIADESVREMVSFLREKLSAADFKKLKEMVGVSDAEDKKFAKDSMPRDYASRWPTAARIGIV